MSSIELGNRKIPPSPPPLPPLPSPRTHLGGDNCSLLQHYIEGDEETKGRRKGEKEKLLCEIEVLYKGRWSRPRCFFLHPFYFSSSSSSVIVNYFKCFVSGRLFPPPRSPFQLVPLSSTFDFWKISIIPQLSNI